MVCNFVAREWKGTVIKSPNDCHLFPFGGKVDTVVTGWLITQKPDWYQQGTEKFVPRYDE
jgi:hypothetical protein